MVTFGFDLAKYALFRKCCFEDRISLRTLDKKMDAAFVNFLLFLIFHSSRLTCAFLACKVDEFNVSSAQFVSNLRESPVGQEKALEQILEYELLLIQQLNFHLIVHNPYRPFEGFLIDLKVPFIYMLCTLYTKIRQMYSGLYWEPLHPLMPVILKDKC